MVSECIQKLAVSWPIRDMEDRHRPGLGVRRLLHHEVVKTSVMVTESVQAVVMRSRSRLSRNVGGGLIGGGLFRR